MRDNRLRFEVLTSCKDKLWLMAWDICAIFSLDIKSGLIKLEKAISHVFGENINRYAVTMVPLDSKLIIPPFDGHDFLSYDTETGEISKLCNVEKNRFYSHITVGDKIYFLSRDYPIIAVYSIENAHIDIVDFLNGLESDGSEGKFDGSEILFIGPQSYIGPNIMNVFYDKSKLLFFDIECLTAREVQIENASHLCMLGEKDGKLLLLDAKNYYVLVYDMYKKSYTKIAFPQEYMLSGDSPFLNMIKYKDRFYVFSTCGEKIIIIYDSYVELYPDDISAVLGNLLYAELIGDKIIFGGKKFDKLGVLDLSDNIVKYIDLFIDDEGAKEYDVWMLKKKPGNIVYEKKLYRGIKSLLDCVESMEYKKE